MSDADRAGDAEAMAGGVRIVAATPEALDLMARLVEALPDELRQTMVALRRDGAPPRYAVEMEDGLDRAELTQPIADGLVEALRRLGAAHGGVSVGRSARTGPAAGAATGPAAGAD